MRAWPERILGRKPPAYAAGEPGDREADRLQRALEQLVLLEAIAAATAIDELLLHRLQIDMHRTPQQRIERVERDRIDLRGLQRRQGLEIRGRRPAVTDARQIVLQPKFVPHRNALPAPDPA